MISASMPPRQKNTNVVTMYMIPIRLWSVVVSQLVHPRASCWTPWATTWGTGASWVAISCAGFLCVLGVFDLSGARLGVQFRARDLCQLVGFFEQFLLVGKPRFELGRRDGLDGRDHARVPTPAEDRALPAVDPRLGDLEPGVVVVSGHRLELAAQRRDPPRVHDVLGDDVQGYGRVRGHDHLLVGIRRAQAVRFARARIDELPDVLAPDHLDVERFAVKQQ